MDLKSIFGLRPKEPTIEDLRATCSRIEAEAARVSGLLSKTQAERGEVLLSGSPDAVASAEAQLATLTAEQGRLAAMLEAARKRLAAEEMETKRKAAAEVVAEARRAHDAWARWYRTEYATHATAIRQGLELEAAAIEATRKVEGLSRSFPDLVTEHLPSTVHAVLPGFNHSVNKVADVVLLPPIEAPKGIDPVNVWPPRVRNLVADLYRSPSAPVDEQRPVLP